MTNYIYIYIYNTNNNGNTYNGNGSKELSARVVGNNGACHGSFTSNWRIGAESKLSNILYR